MTEPRVPTRRLLIIHDAPGVRAAAMATAESNGWEVAAFGTLDDALEARAFDQIIPVALIGPYGGGYRFHNSTSQTLTLVQQLARCSRATQIILLIAPRASLTECVEAVGSGANAFLEWGPAGIDASILVQRLDQALDRFSREQAAAVQFQDGSIFNETGFVGQSDPMAKLLLQALRVARVSDAPVLITGESGTGKQRLAELIHRADPKRRRGSFLSVNCSAITGTLAESALFGHVKGAFTGASKDRLGYFRAAQGGVLLLDEVGELELALQPKLLRVLQEGVVLPVGADREIPVDVRVIAATHRRLAAWVQEGRFRLDLLQRLSVVELDIPPLRERIDDIPVLIDFFVKQYSHYYAGGIDSVDPKVYALLTQHALAGNVRELENIIRRSLIMKSCGRTLDLADLPSAMLALGTTRSAPLALPREIVERACRQIDKGTLTLTDFLHQCERTILDSLLASGQISRTELAKRLGVSRRTLYNKRDRLGL